MESKMQVLFMVFPLLDEEGQAWYGYCINTEGDIMKELELDRQRVLRFAESTVSMELS